MTGKPGQPTESVNRRSSAAVARASQLLAAAGIGPARAEAELITAHILGISRGRLALAGELTADQWGRLIELVGRRARREPLQHLLGTAPFRHLELAVGPGVFVPRPETELLAGWGVAAARSAQPEPIVVDLCSGSGAIALAVANEVPTARVVAVERSATALAWLRRNAADRAAAGDRPIEVVAGDVHDPDLLAGLRGRVAVLLCNPPYVPAGTVVPPEVAEHDPAEAVFAGPDGLAVIRPVIDRAADLLRPGGALGIEHDETQGEVVPARLRADGRFTAVAGESDLTGRPRYVTARRLSDQSAGAGGRPG